VVAPARIPEAVTVAEITQDALALVQLAATKLEQTAGGLVKPRLLD
jgi:hypothetical protein